MPRSTGGIRRRGKIPGASDGRKEQLPHFPSGAAGPLINSHARRVVESIIANTPSFGDYPGEKALKRSRRRQELTRLIKDAGKDAPAVIEAVQGRFRRAARKTGFTALSLTVLWLVLLVGASVAPENSALSAAFTVYTAVLFIPWLLLSYVAVRRLDMGDFVKRYTRQSVGLSILHGGLAERVHLSQRLAGLSPREFEEEIARLYEQIGYEVERGPYVSDFGADLLIEKDDDTWVVQVKRWKKKVGRPTLQRIQGSSVHFGGTPIVVTTSSFTGPAMDYASLHGIELIDGERLSDMFIEAYYA